MLSEKQTLAILLILPGKEQITTWASWKEAHSKMRNNSESDESLKTTTTTTFIHGTHYKLQVTVSGHPK